LIHRRRERSVLICLGLVAVCVHAAADDWSAYRPQVEELLADEAVADIELGDDWRSVEPPPQRPWPDPDVIYLNVAPSRDYWDGYFVINQQAGQVVGFVGPEPKGPVPMEIMPAEQPIPIAREFCQRHLPEAVTEGGEFTAQVEERITTHGAWMVHLQRTVQGVTVPTLADVGVRVYDGKVVWFRRKHQALDEGLQLPGEVTLEQAQQTAAAHMPHEEFEAALWLAPVREMISTEAGQRNVWTLCAEARRPGSQSKQVERFACWHVDANSGEIVDSELVKPTTPLMMAYKAAGGTRWASGVSTEPSLPRMCSDSRPLWSPDGSRLLFFSDRQRPGYPDWLKASPGLFVVNADGTGLRCLLPAGGSGPCWLDDGQRVGYRRFGVKAMPVTGGEPELLFDDEELDCTDSVWVSETQLVAYLWVPSISGRLVLVDLADPEAPRKEITPKHGWGQYYAALNVSADGKRLLCTHHSTGEGWRVLSFDLTAESPEAEVIAERLDTGDVAQLVGADRMLVQRKEREFGQHPNAWMVDLTSGEVEPWWPPQPVWAGEAGEQELKPDNVCFSADGQRIAFVAAVSDPARQRPWAHLVFTCKLDGSDLRQVTPWENPIIPLAGE
jgi:hypothetical protein